MAVRHCEEDIQLQIKYKTEKCTAVLNTSSNQCLLIHQQMHTMYYKTDIEIKSTPVCFGVIALSSGSSTFVSAKVMNY